MSIDALKEFTKAVVTNETYQEKAKKIGLNDIDGLVKFGKELGYEFSLEDLQAYANETGSQKDELSEEDLELVAGGVATTTALAVVTGFAAVVSAVGAIGSLAVATGALAVQVGNAVKGW